MKLGLLELWRRPGRFGGALAILFLLGSLLLLLSGLVQGLNANNDGILRRQDADLVVFSSASERSIAESLLDAATVERISSVPGVTRLGGLRAVPLAARVPGRGPRDLVDVVVVGHDLPFGPVPDGSAASGGGAWADRALEASGVAVGTTVLVGPARTALRIDGFVDDAGFQGRPTLWIPRRELDPLVAVNQPDAAIADAAVAVLLVRTTDPAATAAAIDRATGSTSTLALTTAADAVPKIGGGVLDQIIGLTVVITAAVIALFFALLTGERTTLFGVLKAIGGRNRSILATVATQALALAAVAGTSATLVAVAFDAALPAGTIPFDLTPSRVVVAFALLLGAAVVGAGSSLRRLLRIDPASAIGGAP